MADPNAVTASVRAPGRLVRLGVPIALTTFLEVSLFSIVALLIGRLGIQAVAARRDAQRLTVGRHHEDHPAPMGGTQAFGVIEDGGQRVGAAGRLGQRVGGAQFGHALFAPGFPARARLAARWRCAGGAGSCRTRIR